MTSIDMVTVTLGAVWADDAVGRRLDIGTGVARTLTLTMTAAQTAEALSVARNDAEG